MNPAIWYLLVTRKKNAGLRFLAGLRRPKKILGLLCWVGIMAALLGSQFVAPHRAEFQAAASPLAALLAFFLLAALFGGLMQRGPTFQAADIDFLFPGPFSRRTVVLYRLLTLYPITLVSTLFLIIFLGPRLPNPWLGLVGIAFCQIIALHLQTASAILATTINDRVFGHMRKWIQVALLVLLGGGLVAGITAFAGHGGTSESLRALFRSRLMVVFFYPATAADALSQAPGLAQAWRPLLGLAVSYGVTLLAVLGLQVNFFEASIQSSRRLARTLSRARRGVPVHLPQPGTGMRSIPLPAAPFFAGAGAVLWKNLLSVGRSLRVVFLGLVMTAVFTSVAVSLAGQMDGGQLIWKVLLIGAMLPFILQQHVAFDFRRDIDSMAELKLLPVAPFALAAAEVLAPVLLALIYQWILVLAAGFFVDLPQLAYWAPLLLYPPVTLAIAIITNIGFLIYPVKMVNAAGRPNAGGAMLSALLNILVLLACLAPASIAGAATYFLTGQVALAPAVVVALATQWLVDGGMLWILGRLFRGFDLARDG